MTNSVRDYRGSTRRRLLIGTVASIGGGLALPAFSRGYPEKPIRWLVPYNAGGATDVSARAIAEGLAAALGQSILVDNRPGGAGRVATQALLAAPADGYTVMTADNSILYNNWALFDKLPYTPESFDYVAMTGSFPLVLAVNKNVASTFEGWRQWLKRNSGQAGFGSPGVGSPHHIAWSLLADRMGVQLQHVPYKGDSAVIVDLVSGQIPMALLGVGNALQFAKDPRLSFISVIWPSRLSAMPSVPTFDEVGVRNFDVTAEQGLLSAAGTPKSIVERLNLEVARVLKTQSVREKLETIGMYSVFKSPDEFKAHARKQAIQAGQIIKAHGITVS
ncbi:MAG: tripartite tricarboxylate transporter substrate binding protein [Ottowia sp.]|uniref:Bug family tripartite tricarboxylate transporter substrate binding protein n=1 Tax=Ottowia sp. TaxID=1898956 RepID=UPI003C73CD85